MCAIHTQELDTAALHTARLAGRAVGVLVVAVLLGHLAVVAGVAVHDDADHTHFLRTLDL